MRRIFILSLLVSLSALALPLTAQTGGPFKVVVHPSNPVSQMSAAEVSRHFLKRTTRWPVGGKVLPVDQLPGSAVRIDFSKAVHRKKVDAVKSYWQAQLFSGTATPPPELSSDAEVLSYVRSNAGAIGYVSRSATVGDGVKVVEVTG